MVKSDQITAYIEPLTKEELMRLWENNEYTTVGTGGSYVPEFKGDGLFLPGLEWKIIMNDGEARRYRVAEEQYPNLYALARKGPWLRKAASRKRRAGGLPLASK